MAASTMTPRRDGRCDALFGGLSRHRAPFVLPSRTLSDGRRDSVTKRPPHRPVATSGRDRRGDGSVRPPPARSRHRRRHRRRGRHDGSRRLLPLPVEGARAARGSADLHPPVPADRPRSRSRRRSTTEVGRGGWSSACSTGWSCTRTQATVYFAHSAGVDAAIEALRRETRIEQVVILARAVRLHATGVKSNVEPEVAAIASGVADRERGELVADPRSGVPRPGAASGSSSRPRRSPSASWAMALAVAERPPTPSSGSRLVAQSTSRCRRRSATAAAETPEPGGPRFQRAEPFDRPCGEQLHRFAGRRPDQLGSGSHVGIVRERVGDHLEPPQAGRRIGADVVLDDRVERHADRRLDEGDDDAGPVLARHAVHEHRPVADVRGDDLHGAHDVATLPVDHLVVQRDDVGGRVDASPLVGRQHSVDDAGRGG